MHEKQGNNQVWTLYNADGKLIKKLYQYPFDVNVERILNYSEVKWSPSGETLAILYYRTGGILTLLTPGGEEITTIVTGLDVYGGYVGQINWSPDGQWLVFPSKGENTYVDIYKIGVNGENLQQLTNTTARDSSPYFLPLGKEIMFTSGSSGCWVMKPDGSDVKSGVCTSAWSPDEKYYLVTNPLPKFLYLVDAQTKTSTQIFSSTENKFYIGKYFFSQDGKWVYLAEYNSGGDDQRWYRVNIAELKPPELLVTACRNKFDLHEGFGDDCGFYISPDETLILFDGWRSKEDMDSSEPKPFALDLKNSKIFALSEKAYPILYGYWQPGSEPAFGYDPLSFLKP